MNTLRQSLYLFAVLIAGAFLSWFGAGNHDSVQMDANELIHSADAIVINIKLRQFDANGSLVNFLESPRMQHIPATDSHFFTKPHIVLTGTDEPQWDIRSEKAESTDKNSKIVFRSQVVVHQARSKDNQESTFKTEELTYFPKQKFATTASAVRFEQPGSVVLSTGMNAYLENKHIELLGKTHATYTPGHA